METKKIGDMAQRYGIVMALHMAGSPVAAMANVHCAAATENFLALENHSVDQGWWNELIEGPAKPIVREGYIPVPETPGLGIELNEEAAREHLDPDYPGYFSETGDWDQEIVYDNLWS